MGQIDIRTAILKAADYIEQNPKDFTLANLYVPRDWSGQGCALGRIFQALGKKAGSLNISHCEKTLGCSEREFFERMNAITPYGMKSWILGENCPDALRAYADKYPPAESSKTKPSGSQICEMILSNREIEHERI